MIDLLASWTETLLTTFRDAEIKANIELLDLRAKTMLADFMAAGEFSLPLDRELVDIIKEVLRGIEKVEISLVSLDELKNVLGKGNPLTVDDVRVRFNTFINDKISSVDKSRTRVVVK